MPVTEAEQVRPGRPGASPLLASCETRSAARWTVAAADEPGVLLFRECGYAQPVATGPIGSPANFDSRSRLTAGPRPPMRGQQGTEAPGSEPVKSDVVV